MELNKNLATPMLIIGILFGTLYGTTDDRAPSILFLRAVRVSHRMDFDRFSSLPSGVLAFGD